MTFDEVVRFAHASNHALASAGTDNRVKALIELAWEDWRTFLIAVQREFERSSLTDEKVRLDQVGEVQLYGCIIRPKGDTIPASVAFGAALTALPKLSKAAGCYTGVTVVAANGDPRALP